MGPGTLSKSSLAYIKPSTRITSLSMTLHQKSDTNKKPSISVYYHPTPWKFCAKSAKNGYF